MTYQAHFQDHGGRIFSVTEFEADHDEAAISHAAERFKASIGHGYEIRQGNRRVHYHTYGPSGR